MGNFICAVVILALVIIFTGVNSAIICNICDDMIELIDEGKLEEACAMWEEKHAYIALFVRDAEIDVVNAEVQKTDAALPFEDGEAESAIMTLREAVAELKNSEFPSWQSVF